MLVTGQARFLAVVYLIISVLIVGTFIYDTVKNQFSVGALFAIIFMMALFVLLVYDTDCLRVGSCDTWSTIRTVLNSIFPIIFLVFYLYIVIMGIKQKVTQVKEEEEPKEES